MGGEGERMLVKAQARPIRGQIRAGRKPSLSEIRSELAGSQPQLSASWKIPPLGCPCLPSAQLPPPSSQPTGLAPQPAPASSQLLKGLDGWHKGPASSPALGLLESKGRGATGCPGTHPAPAPLVLPAPAPCFTQDPEDTLQPCIQTFPGARGTTQPLLQDCEMGW